MPNVREVWQAIHTALKADATLLALLGDNTDLDTGGKIAVVDGHPDQAMDFPFTWWKPSLDVVPITGTGCYEGRFDWNFAAFTYGAGEEIYNHLTDNFWVPINRPEGITSDNFEVTELRPLFHGRLPEPKAQVDGKSARIVVSEWAIQIRPA